MEGIYISRVQIKNFRNFKNVDVSLNHKQVIIGENGCGKTNFLKAIQLIFDPSLSDRDRNLSAADFNDSIVDPLRSGEVIEISVEIKGYENNNQLIAIYRDAVISDSPPTLRFVYKYEPVRDEEQRILHYQYSIHLGNYPQNRFQSYHRDYIKVQVIKALRDVEREIKSLKKSPVFQLVDQYNIPEEELAIIADELKEASDSIMELDEMIEIKKLVQQKFKVLSGNQIDNKIHLSTFDIDPERLLHTLQILLGEKRRPVSEVSLGLCNILYISLMLLLNRDRTIPGILKERSYNELLRKDTDRILPFFYFKNEKGNYLFKEDIANASKMALLYTFMNKNYFPSQSFTILAVEEPEAHLHPVLQRLIYREVLHKSDTSVIFTSHSTHLTSVAPVESIVHVKRIKKEESVITSNATIVLPTPDLKDIERYLDTRRGEIYFGSGVILVEGIAEEYLIPKFAELLDFPLDNFQIVVCNINSTNFKPYVQILNSLSIPWCIITDGDYYEIDTEEDLFQFYYGQDLVKRILIELELVKEDEVPKDIDKINQFLANYGCFIGEQTLEIDIMKHSKNDGIGIYKKVFGELKPGGAKQQQNFDKLIDERKYEEVLRKIEMPGIGKGRFSQRLSIEAIAEQVPPYIKNAIEYIISKVKISE